MLAAENVFADANQNTSLINQVLACAEQDININEILRYIVTIHKNDESNANLVAAINNPENKEQIKTLLTFLYTTWLGRCTGELFNLATNPDACCVPDHKQPTIITPDQFPMTNRAISAFISSNNFPQSGRRSLPEEFINKINRIIDSAQAQTIKPFDDNERPQNNYILQGLTKFFTKPDLSKALGNIKSDSNRIFNYEDLKASSSFKNALAIISEPFRQFLKEYKAKTPAVPAVQTPFIHEFTTKKSEEIDEYANLNLVETVQKYIGKRKAENKKYHRWGSFFALFTNKPFSVEDKEIAVNKIIYWEKRETNELTDESNDSNNQFSPRDIAAIHDHRLGMHCKKHNARLERLFKFAESKLPALVEVSDTAPLLPPPSPTAT